MYPGRHNLCSTQSRVDERACVPGKVHAVRPGIAPDGECVRETWSGYHRRETFKCHGTCIVDRRQCSEECGKIHCAAAQIATVIFPHMHITQLVATREYRSREVGLLDVHVIGIQVHFEIISAHVCYEPKRLLCSIK